MLKGSIVALVTPFDESGKLDFAALARLVSFHLEAGTDALVIGGSTGESTTLRAGELPALLEAVVAQVGGRIPVIAGTGTAATDRVIENNRMASSHGADAVLVVTPYYNRPTQHGLLAHFRAVADSSELPVILYNVPSRTAVDMLPETVQLLAAHERIVAIKEAVGKMERIDALRQLCDDNLVILSGDDHTCLEAMRHGARGVISVVANAMPRAFKSMCDAALSHDWSAAEQEDKRMRRVFDLLMIESNPIPVKWALHEMSLCSPQLRLPLTPLSVSHREALRSCLAELGAVNL